MNILYYLVSKFINNENRFNKLGGVLVKQIGIEQKKRDRILAKNLLENKKITRDEYEGFIRGHRDAYDLLSKFSWNELMKAYVEQNREMIIAREAFYHSSNTEDTDEGFKEIIGEYYTWELKLRDYIAKKRISVSGNSEGETNATS